MNGSGKANTASVAGASGIRRFDSVAIAHMLAVTAVLLAAACATAAEVPAAIAPQPIISRGVPAYASAGTAAYFFSFSSGVETI